MTVDSFDPAARAFLGRFAPNSEANEAQASQQGASGITEQTRQQGATSPTEQEIQQDAAASQQGTCFRPSIMSILVQFLNSVSRTSFAGAGVLARAVYAK